MREPSNSLNSLFPPAIGPYSGHRPPPNAGRWTVAGIQKRYKTRLWANVGVMETWRRGERGQFVGGRCGGSWRQGWLRFC
ncbi:hypothetical protein J1N35_026452 [Gossypium stocksii]|uniref:Uncharacterized protein n=1 Tax=Gossypium stocksii TaxID=47602 RepID=A0A9D3V8H2_9ROSI|nr:hypothetical protein J1N35_026452 [Gossypium stocksii]